MNAVGDGVAVVSITIRVFAAVFVSKVVADVVTGASVVERLDREAAYGDEDVESGTETERNAGDDILIVVTAHVPEGAAEIRKIVIST